MADSRLAPPADDDSAMDVDTAPAASASIARQPSQPGDKPRGILKRQPSMMEGEDAHAESSTGRTAPAQGVSWNETNLYNNEASRDSTMKINEPKTPYVQWNPETDEVMNIHQIPGFELGLAESVRSPSSATQATLGEGGSGTSHASGSASDRSGPSSRHSSFSGSRHSSFSGSRRGSDSMGEKKVDIEVPDDHTGEIDTDDYENMDDEAREKHRRFKSMRKNHYGSEADAMRRAQALIDQEEALELEDDDTHTQANAAPRPVPALPNGHA